jgi:hypothetical protein
MLEGLEPPKLNNRTCKVGTIAETLSESDRKILLDAALDSERWPAKTLVKALRDRGVFISDSPIYSHRAKTCVCFRD